MTFQNSTGALISDKDRELETLRNEVLAIDFHIIPVSLIWAVKKI